MLFKNLTLFRFPASVVDRLAGLETALAEHPLRACGPMEQHTKGWVSPYGRDDASLTASHGHAVLMALGSETKILPTAVVNREIAKKVSAIEQERGAPVGARERRTLKDQVLNELMPRALVKPGRTLGYIDKANGWIVVNTSSRKAGEDFVSALRAALGSLPAVGMEPESSPRVLMTEWLTDGKCPEPWTMGGDCDMKDIAAKSSAARFRQHDLCADEVREHLAHGKQVSQLALVYHDRASLTLDEALCLRKFKLLDVALETLDKGDRANADAELDAQFVLSAGEIASVLESLSSIFGLHRPESF